MGGCSPRSFLSKAERNELSIGTAGRSEKNLLLQETEDDFDGNADGNGLARGVAGWREAPGLDSADDFAFKAVADVTKNFNIGGAVGMGDGQLEKKRAAELGGAGIFRKDGVRAIFALRFA